MHKLRFVIRLDGVNPAKARAYKHTSLSDQHLAGQTSINLVKPANQQELLKNQHSQYWQQHARVEARTTVLQFSPKVKQHPVYSYLSQ